MKKFFKRLLFKEKGSVSVFAILIILPIFLLNALFIDTIRIISAERQIENSIDTALRSTMAEFNEKLAAVGLFGYSGSQAEAQSDFQHYLNEQMYSSGGLNGAFTLAKPDIHTDSATASFDTGRNLVDLDVFEHQVLESMKYQAPAQIGEEIFNLVRNSGLDNFSEEDANSVEELSESYEEIFELADKRNEKIDDARKEVKKYISMINKNGQLLDIIGPPNPDLDEKIPNNIENTEELIFYNERYHELTDDEGDDNEDGDDEENEEEQQEIENYEKALSELKGDHLDKFDKFRSTRSTINRLLFGTGPAAGSPDNYGPSSAMDYNDQMSDIMGDINFEDFDIDEQAQEEIDKMENMILDEAFFDDIYNRIEKLDEQFLPNQSMSQEDALNGGYASRTVVELVDGFHKIIEDHEDAATSIKDTLRQRYNSYRNDDAKLLQSHLNDYDESKELMEQKDGLEDMEDEADDAYDDLWNKITEAEDLASDQAKYDQLTAIISEYDAVNGSGDNDDPGRTQFIKDAFDRFKQFLTFVKEFPESFRNQLYINEYIMANYGTNEPYSLGDSASYLYENKQAQFITYGYTTAGANYAAFIRDIAMVLFVVSLIDTILFEGGYAGPLGVLRAIVRALIDTASGITQLTEKSKYPWKPLKISGQIEMTMPLFLRIFMIMRSTAGDGYNNKKMRRLQAAITLDTDVQLDENPSYIKGKVKGDVDLLFIPALTNLIPNQSGSLSGNTYTIEKSKVYSY
ncbi:hypothetical protein [Lentibacillus salicampi]|uniref:Uncharacterized protein n=1 Tax=Lentibacillus salicampi TaxID=175306 RepID=A0A4Y9AA16_9BACI|nr:hypothetical protein [Lentibacillus salicampi]TFJ91204.1 hypothetical protein E4U82_18945 [Lentibacillus salicampi]